MKLYTYLNYGGNCQEAFRFAQLRDKFGTSWTIIHERPRPSNGQ